MSEKRVLYTQLFRGGKSGLEKTMEFLNAREKISNFRPTAIVIIDAFSERGHNQAKILSEMASGSSLCKHVYYYFFKSEFNLPCEESALRKPHDLRSKLSEHDKDNKPSNVFVIAPYTLHHFLFIKAVIYELRHPAFDYNGQLVSDARWVVNGSKKGDLDAMLRNSIGYAMPYPDALGDGHDVVNELEAVESGMDYGVIGSYAEERVDNSIGMVERYHRCHFNEHTGIVEVHAIGTGLFHTGTLIALIKEKWPKAKWVTIRNDRGPVAKKTGNVQISIASLNCCDERLLKLTKDLTGEIVIASPVFIHVDRDVAEQIIPHIQQQR